MSSLLWLVPGTQGLFQVNKTENTLMTPEEIKAYFLQTVDNKKPIVSTTITGTYVFLPEKTSGQCPSCGYCQHCGRGGHYNYPYYPVPYYPTYSTWYGNSGGTGWQDNSSGT